MLRADLHIHSCYSGDCDNLLEGIVRRCLERGINCIAITDHNTVEGALRIRKLAPFTVIVGEEILTQEGEIMGFFLEETVPRKLSLMEAIDQVQAQGGLVGVPHPFDRVARNSLGRSALERVLPHIHFVEGFNARSRFSQDSIVDFGQQHGIALSAGSDAHTLREIGNAYVEIPPFTTPQQFLLSLSQGRIGGHLTPFWIHGISLWYHLRRRWQRR